MNMPLRESRLQAIMWMIFLAGVGAFIAGQTIIAVLAVLAVAAIAFSTTTRKGERRASTSSSDDLVASN